MAGRCTGCCSLGSTLGDMVELGLQGDRLLPKTAWPSKGLRKTSWGVGSLRAGRLARAPPAAQRSAEQTAGCAWGL